MNLNSKAKLIQDYYLNSFIKRKEIRLLTKANMKFNLIFNDKALASKGKKLFLTSLSQIVDLKKKEKHLTHLKSFFSGIIKERILKELRLLKIKYMFIVMV